MTPASARARKLRTAVNVGLALVLPLVLLGGCSQALSTQGALVCTPLDAGDSGLKSSLTHQSLPPDEAPICGPWKVCD